MDEPIAHDVMGAGVRLRLYEWRGSGRPIFLAHATGFHARCWDQVVRHLPGRHVYALDQRGHGLSEKPEPPYHWDHFGEDVAAVAAGLGISGAIGVGHSKGGHAVTAAMGIRSETFAALLLVDPVILPPDAYARRLQAEGSEHFAAKRRNEWASPAEMIARFAGRPPFNRWQAEVLRDYCTYGLVPNPDGPGYVLACPPRIEAAVYAGSASSDIYRTITGIHVPVRVLRARGRAPGAEVAMDMSGSPTAPDLASKFSDAEDVYLPEMTHFIPMEDPGLVARHVLELERRIAG